MLSPIASNTTVVTLDANRTIHSGSGVVYGLMIKNTSGGTVTVTARNTADDKEWAQITVANNATEVWPVPCVFTGGYVLESASAATVVATVAHTNPQGA